ncbi:metal-binding protein [Adhaeribacter arboris]|uniref:Metal-binding protein n=1 Tax=Adhaeribacter arboris TaxID=2072846 RepID=A0A2T2YDR0_9BACT|nr:Ada metal-binding domain-containing protein [Adhaeribacter arboris]PSR53650.1 metal-binding protein [Adhaeribacter arboris]
MTLHIEISHKELQKQIRLKQIVLGGNQKLKIYGHLNCASGKRMKKENRVFFVSEAEAQNQGFRPCGHCMAAEFRNWKNGLI